jgi:hypothetical protein
MVASFGLAALKVWLDNVMQWDCWTEACKSNLRQKQSIAGNKNYLSVSVAPKDGVPFLSPFPPKVYHFHHV